MINLSGALTIAQDMLIQESQLLSQLSDSVKSESFTKAIELLTNTKGKIIICGSGKYEYIGNKIADTISSVGGKSYFIFPSEISYTIHEIDANNDVVLILTHHGENKDLLAAIKILKNINISTIALTAAPNSVIASHSNIVIPLFSKEPLIQESLNFYNTIPIISHSMMLSIGNALTMVIASTKGIKHFKDNSYILNINKLTSTRIQEIMIQGDSVPKIHPDSNIEDAIEIMNQKKLGFVAIVNRDNEVVGIFTDGDLRRTITKHKNISKLKVHEAIQSSYPKMIDYEIIGKNATAIDAMSYMQSNKITSLLIVDADNTLIGALHIHSLLDLGLAS
jgi:arabinose-5-phosphate isomerase